jgi:hypothetical protein
MADAARLAAEIRSTFANAPLPKGVMVAEHDCEECDGIRNSFARKAPFALPGDLIEQHFDSLPMLSPAGYHVFMPAYLAHAVENPVSLVAEFVWYSLSPAELDDFWVERYGRFSNREKAVVAQVVEFMIAGQSKIELSPEEMVRARRYWRAA